MLTRFHSVTELHCKRTFRTNRRTQENKNVAITNDSNSQSHHLKTRNNSELNNAHEVKHAPEAMLSLKAQKESVYQDTWEPSTPHREKTRHAPGSVTLDCSPLPKRQRVAAADDIFDREANEVCEVSEWELILASWNPEQENLPFSVLDSAIVKSF